MVRAIDPASEGGFGPATSHQARPQTARKRSLHINYDGTITERAHAAPVSVPVRRLEVQPQVENHEWEIKIQTFSQPDISKPRRKASAKKNQKPT